VLVILALLIAVSCRREPAGEGPPPPAPVPPAAPQAPQPRQEAPAVATAFPIRTDGRQFVDAAGRAFEWRGITAFRLAEMIASRREKDAAAYLDWAKSQGLNVVRVLLMAQHLFELTPEAGRAALPKLLDLAKERGIAVEVVALADTRDVKIDYEAHVREVGRMAMEKGNAFIELANEPGHPTQDDRVHQPGFLQELANLLPAELVVALGSYEYGDGFAGGDYATTHVPRGDEGWDHVFEVATRAKRATELEKPVVSDEPIGAGPEYQPGRRDDDPERFGAAAALTCLAGLHATFHYEGGLHSRIPTGPEADSLSAWKAGLELVGAPRHDGEFLQPDAVSRIAKIDSPGRAYARVMPDTATILIVNAGDAPAVTLQPEWKEASRSAIPGALLINARRAQR
jgi:hypothetical protein